MPLRVGIVGCGKIADGHVEEILKLPQAKLAAVCDLEPLMAEQLAVRHRIPAFYADFDRMLDAERLDVVHVTTPPGAHPALAVKAMRAGCHVFVEKPFALDAHGARVILDHARQLNRKVSINYWPNFDPIAVRLQQLIAAGVLGEPVHIESYYGYNLGGDFGAALLADPQHWVHQLPGKLLHNVLDHIVNRIVPFLPDSAPAIAAIGYRTGDPTGNVMVDDVFDEVRFILGGARTSAYGTFTSHAQPVGNFMRIYGTKNTVHVDYRVRTLVVESEQSIPSALGRLLPAFSLAGQYFRQGRRNVGQFARSEFHFFAGMRRLISLFYDSIRNDTAPPIPYDEILRVSELMDRIIAHVQPSREPRLERVI